MANHLEKDNELVLGAHMLEICPSIAARKPSCEIHPLGIGDKEDPVRLIFDTKPGPAVNATLVDLGNRFRLVVNEVDVRETPEALPKLPVARAVWKPRPNLQIAAAAWIYAGGSHHPVFSQALRSEHFEDYAEMLGLAEAHSLTFGRVQRAPFRGCTAPCRECPLWHSQPRVQAFHPERYRGTRESEIL